MMRVHIHTSNYFTLPGLKNGVQFKKISKAENNSILAAVCEYYEMDMKFVIGKRRFREYIEPRQIAQYLIRKHTTLSLKEIGRIFTRDHTTVINSVRVIEDLLDTDHSIRKAVTAVERQLF